MYVSVSKVPVQAVRVNFTEAVCFCIYGLVIFPYAYTYKLSSVERFDLVNRRPNRIGFKTGRG